MRIEHSGIFSNVSAHILYMYMRVVCMNILVEHDGLCGVDDNEQEEHAEEVKLELLVRLKGILPVQFPFLEGQSWPTELLGSLK